MKKSKTKILAILALVVIMLLSILPLKSLANNSNFFIVKENDNKFLIYVDGMLNNNFEFAFSNVEDAIDLNYISAVKDSKGNYVAYVDEELMLKFFNAENTYIWVRNTKDEVVVKANKITINDAKTIEQLSSIQNLTKSITVEASAENEKIKINGEDKKDYYYKFITLESSEEYGKLANLINEINSFDKNTTTYQKLQKYNELSELYNKLVQSLGEDNWTKADNLEISKPYDAKDGEQYVLWLKDNNENMDIQILTAYEKEIKVVEEHEKTEKIITALPVTYDDTTVLFIALGTVIIAIMVIIAFKIINKKNRK